ncbi:MAG: APC family permease [Acidimicrobiia bacterium]|nr:APC family permease [Acidimicrobiia bacterium]
MSSRRFKEVFVGRPLASHEAPHQLLPKRLALPVFASDPLSSVAYATEEAMLVLALAGATAFRLVTPVSFAVATLLLVVVISYRQTIRAYPQGGGAFSVASDNFGIGAGAVAASSLLVDYVLTVAVSISAGVAAITSAVPETIPWRVPIAIGFVVLLTVANLRGVKEASTIFAVPTYLFILTVLTMLVVGFARCAFDACPAAISAGHPIEPVMGSVTVFLVLRAFASGATALTGVEAVANGVQAFKEPKAHNAATTLAVMGSVAVTMFLGISTLARLTGVRISHETVDLYGTVISQVGRAVFGGGFGFWALQVFTAAILVLAANTAYQDFPRLSAILADHRLMPRQFRNRGDRLVFSNGVVVLALLAGILIVAFGAEVTRLIQLYVVGVFTSFTISQAGMVRHWLRSRESGWRHSIVINTVGAITTGVVLVVVTIVKFTHGAWIVLVAVPALVAWMLTIRRHYRAVGAQLRALPPEAVARKHRVVLLVAHADEATDRALRYAEKIWSEGIECIHAVETDTDETSYAWRAMHPQRPLTLLEGKDGVGRRIVAHVHKVRDTHPGERVTVVMSDRFDRRDIRELFRHRHSLMIKVRLLFSQSVVVTDVTHFRRRRRSGLVPVPIRQVELVVLVSDLTRPVREALLYAQSLGPPMHAVHVDVEERQRERVLGDWAKAQLDIPLEVLPSPYRGIVDPLVDYLRERRRVALPGTLINVVIPEFIVEGRITQILHNQTGLAIKGVLAREPGIAVTSVPFHLVAHLDEE